MSLYIKSEDLRIASYASYCLVGKTVVQILEKSATAAGRFEQFVVFGFACVNIFSLFSNYFGHQPENVRWKWTQMTFEPTENYQYGDSDDTSFEPTYYFAAWFEFYYLVCANSGAGTRLQLLHCAFSKK